MEDVHATRLCLRLVAPPRPDPFLVDEAQRLADRRTMAGWDGPAPTEVQADRLRLLRRYRVRWVLARASA